MATATIRVVVAMSALWLGGCGTVRNFSVDGDKAVYGGVASSVEYTSYFASGITHIEDLDQLVACVGGTASSLFLDLPLSAVGDTLTLPWTVAVQRDRMKYSDAPPRANDAFRDYWFNRDEAKEESR